MKNICFVHPYFGCGGAEKGLISLSLICKRKNIKTFLFTLNISNQNARNKFDHIHVSPATKTIYSIIDLYNFACRNDVDIIILNQAFCIAIYTLPLTLILNIFAKKNTKLVAFERLSPYSFFLAKNPLTSFLRKFLYHLSLRAISLYAANSHEQVHSIANQFNKLKTLYVRNTVANKLLEPSIPPNINHLYISTSNDIVNLLWVGRLEKVKNPFLALETLKLLPENYNLTIFGSGSLSPFLAEFSNRNNIRQRVKFTSGLVDYSSFDCLIHTANYEGLPNVLIEAISKKVPVISTFFSTGLLELFIPYWVYISPKNSVALAELIIKAMSLQHDEIRKTSDISKLIDSYYSSEEQADDMFELLDLA
ncbi:glycosyltransferase [bacterium]|nr:glycosyltransferase [bacterium]